MHATIVGRATDPHGLRPLINIVHDCFFDVGAVRFDETERAVEVPVRRELPLGAAPLHRLVNWLKGRRREESFAVLKIRRVKSWLVTDDQGVGTYDINSIEFLEKKNKLIIRTGIPTKFELNVDGLDVTVEEPALTQ